MTLGEGATEPGVWAFKHDVNTKGSRNDGGVNSLEKRKELWGQIKRLLRNLAEFPTQAIAGFK